MNFIEKLAEESQPIVKALKNDRFKGLLNLLTELYPDNAHFIYELLQNAEDAQATKVKFILTYNDLTFSHNGKRQFTEPDIESITGIGNTTKKDDINQIGKFGVGFKAVFSYTNTPKIYSGQYAFEIHDLVCPKEIEQVLNPNDSSTLFCFPFNHPEKSKEQAFEEIKQTLTNLSDNTILFLQNIKEIKWEIGQDKIVEGYIKLLSLAQENHFEIERKNIEIIKTYWLRFTQNIIIEKSESISQNSSIAIAFRLEKNIDKNSFEIDNKINKADVSIFFPAEKEVSNLRFFLHAPFSATVARDSIQNRPENNDLRDLLVELLVESLFKIKEFRLMNQNFLSILPNKDDQLSKFYLPFREAVIKTFQNESITPNWEGGFSPAKNLIQASDEIKKVINKNSILSFITDSDNINTDSDWAINPQRVQRVSAFLDTLKIPFWNWETLLKKIGKAFNNQTKANEFLKDVSDEWLQSFYVLLGKAKRETHRYFSNSEKIEEANIVRLQNGELTTGKGVYFQTEFVKNSENIKIVKKDVYNLGDENKKNETKDFLKLIGVKEFEEKDEILTILNQYYTSQNLRYTKDQNIRHLGKFIEFWKRNSADVGVFSNYYFLRVENNDETNTFLSLPKSIFIDEPYQNTKLSLIEKFFNKNRLWGGYIDEIKPKKDFISFLKVLGIAESLKNEYKQIDWFENTIKNKSKELSLLFWESMCLSDEDFKPFPYNSIRNEPHSNIAYKLIKDLSYYAWIPDKNGKFRTPQEMTRELLPDDFVYNNKNGWLSAIGFEVNAKKLSENEEKKQAIQEQQRKDREKLAKDAGFSSFGEMEKAKEFAEMSPDEKALWEKFKKQIEEKKDKAKLREQRRNQSRNEKLEKQAQPTHETNEEKENDEEENRIKHRNNSKYEETQLINARYGQGTFRANVERIENKCRLTNVTHKKFLIASHIKPWRKCTDQEKLDGNNGLLLSPHVDKLFDKGWISFTDNGEIICASIIVEEVMEMWNLDIDAFVGDFNEKQKNYLAYHRENILKL